MTIQIEIEGTARIDQEKPLDTGDEIESTESLTRLQLGQLSLRGSFGITFALVCAAAWIGFCKKHNDQNLRVVKNIENSRPDTSVMWKSDSLEVQHTPAILEPAAQWLEPLELKANWLTISSSKDNPLTVERIRNTVTDLGFVLQVNLVGNFICSGETLESGIVGALADKRVEDISFQDVHLPSDAVLELSKLRELESINVHYCKLDSDFFSSLAEIDGLRTLQLTGPQWDPQDLLTLKNHPSLRHIYIAVFQHRHPNCPDTIATREQVEAFKELLAARPDISCSSNPASVFVHVGMTIDQYLELKLKEFSQ